jgi:hypothetical protein
MRAVRLLLGAIGVAVMGLAVLGAAHDPFIRPGRQTAFLLAVLVVHDALLMPAFLLAGYLVHRLVPARARAGAQAALIVTAALIVVALPLVLGYGRIPDNPSALPRDYGAGLAGAIALSWVLAGLVWSVYGRWARRRGRGG